jgi:PAS domain S-box-containing protein
MPFRRQPSSIRVLHVDDDNEQLEMVKQFLGVFDPEIEIDSLSNPREASKKIRSHYYDCIITDFKMPEMTGIELARQIRQNSAIPIILYTGQGSEEVAAEAYDVGINDYIRKELTSSHYQILAKRVRDIVEKRRIEHIYSNVVKDAKDAIAIVANNKLIFANETFLNLLGTSENDLYKGDNSWLIKEIEKNILEEDIQSLLTGEKSVYQTEIELKKRDRRKTPVDVKISVIEYLGDKVLLFFIRDITDRKALENEIKKSENKYRTLLKLAPDGVITIGLTGTVTWINDSYSTITGYTAKEIIGKKVWALKTVRPTDIRLFFGLFFDLLRGKEVPAMEFQWLGKDGNYGWGEGRASLIKIEEEKKEVLLSLRDITERKQMEEDLKKYSKDMERLAEERAEKLLESEKMVIAGTIASTVAHDLKGPLNTILNAVYLMDIKPEKSDEMKEIIKKAVGNASKMLDEARSKTVSKELNYEEVNIALLLETIINETAKHGRIQIRTYLEHFSVEIDKLRIRRVIENLMRNAFEAMPSKGILTFTTRKDGEFAVLEVEDTGIGISKEKLVTLFKPFQTTKETGTGLGLTYCKNTIDDHRGQIEVKSKVGSGTKFIIRIPIKKPTSSKDVQAAIPVVNHKPGLER